MLDQEPTQRQLVAGQIDWGTVESRLLRFPAIGRAFPLDRLQVGTTPPPYYCHYMAWRLGTWSTEELFVRLEELLRGAEVLPDWSAQASMLTSSDFAEFWSLVWQLQVAEYLRQVGTDVRWGASGPDLSAYIESERWFVECYAYRKSFGLMLFIEGVLERIDPSICVAYNLCKPFSLPSNAARNQFLHEMLLPFRDPEFVEKARSQSVEAYPVVLVSHESGLVVYMEGPDPDAYVPGFVPEETGDSQGYLAVAFREAIRAKQNANSLARNHPNLLAVNYALSMDFQLALGRAGDLGLALPAIERGPNIDAFAVAATGIHERLTRCGLRRVAPLAHEGMALERVTCAT